MESIEDSNKAETDHPMAVKAAGLLPKPAVFLSFVIPALLIAEAVRFCAEGYPSLWTKPAIIRGAQILGVVAFTFSWFERERYGRGKAAWPLVYVLAIALLVARLGSGQVNSPSSPGSEVCFLLLILAVGLVAVVYMLGDMVQQVKQITRPIPIKRTARIAANSVCLASTKLQKSPRYRGGRPSTVAWPPGGR